MTKSNDGGERTCPLCTEEMDLTDQQLKPCRCGYEICVWCWHHIMEMAEKDGGEGRCPACRTPYDKEKIVGTTAKCERVASEAQNDRRKKAQKGRSKSSAEARKHLTDVRVVRRNLVYIVGLPLTIADVQILKRKEYFGQYGDIVKISVSRPSNGAMQSASGNAVGVYVTYAKEDEAVRCIQAVHNFVLEGKPLRACFGTTKYCHSWIKNKPCINPECYYLHDIGSQEDHFSKNETISTYTWSGLPQMSSSNSRCHAGNILPPPADTSGDISSSKISSKLSFNYTATDCRGSTPNENITTESSVLPTPTACGLRPSGSTSTSKSCSQGSTHQKLGVNRTKQVSAGEEGTNKPGKRQSKVYECSKVENTRAFDSCKTSSADGSQEKVPLSSDASLHSSWHDDIATTTATITESSCTTNSNGSSMSLHAFKGNRDRELHASVVEPSIGDSSTRYIASAWDEEDDAVETHSSVGCLSSVASITGYADDGVLASDNGLKVIDEELRSGENYRSRFPIGLPGSIASQSGSHLCEEINMTSTTFLGSSHNCSIGSNNLDDTNSRLSLMKVDDGSSIDLLNDSGLGSFKCQRGNLNIASLGMPSAVSEDNFVSGIISNPSTELEKQALAPLHSVVKDAFEASSSDTNYHFDVLSQAAVAETSGAQYLLPIGRGLNCSSNLCDSESTHNCLSGSRRSNDTIKKEASYLPDDSDGFFSRQNIGSKFGSLSNHGNSSGEFSHTEGIISEDNRGSTAISSILSIDFDPWSDTLSSNNDFLKFLREKSYQRTQPNVAASQKLQSSNQSRFSFARQEDHASGDMETSKFSTCQDSYGQWSSSSARCSILPQPVATISGHLGVSPDRIPVVSRGKVSAPPGFSGQTRAPPPGFSSQVNSNQLFSRGFTDTQFSGGFSRGNAVQMSQTSNTNDVEFIDPAILAVVRSSPVTVPMEFNSGSFSGGLSSSHNNDLRFQPSVYQSIPFDQNQRISDPSIDSFLHLNGFPPSLSAEHKFGSSSFVQRSFDPSGDSYNQWNSQSHIQLGNELTEVLRNGHGSSSNLSDSEISRYHMANANNFYSRAFGF